ncbi:predicted protein [Postia placenta Mad-698-R]|nr:predicted protein [Postia placenta Mad-698-R]
MSTLAQQGGVPPETYIDNNITMAPSLQRIESSSREASLKEIIVYCNDPSSTAATEDTRARDGMMANTSTAGRVSPYGISATVEQPKGPSAKDSAPSKVGETEASGEAPKEASQDSDDTKISEAWKLCAEQVWAREDLLVQKWKDEISNLLTFGLNLGREAGLFSAALTAFNVQYYVYLQAQTLDPNTQAMLIMIGTLAEMNGGTDAMQPMIAALNASSSAPVPAHVISTNVLWFSALVLSLSAASLAISVSQWLHHHVDRAPSQSRQSVRLWYFRHSMFNEWNVPLIISLLPVLLQTSLALFLIGLVQLLWTLNTIVAGVVTVLVAVLLLLSMLTAVVPAFAPRCPYKSQPALWCFRAISPVRRWITTITDGLLRGQEQGSFRLNCIVLRLINEDQRKRMREWCTTQKRWLHTSNWRDIDDMSVRIQQGNAAETLDMLAEADATVMDDALLKSAVRPCILEATPVTSILPVFHQILRHRAQEVDDLTDPPTFTWSTSEQDAAANTVLREIYIGLLAKHVREIGSGELIEVALLRNMMSMIKAAPRVMRPTTANFDLLQSVIRPCLLQAPSAEPVLPALYQVLEYRAQGVDTSAEPSTLIWSTSEQDATEITYLTEMCIRLLERYSREIGSGEFREVALLHHLASLIKSMAPNAARTISCQIMETFQTCASRRATLEERRGLWGVFPEQSSIGAQVSFINAVVRPSIQPRGLPLEIALQVYHNIVRCRIRGIDYSRTWVQAIITEADANAVTAMGHLSLEMFSRITSEVIDTTELHQQQMQTLAIMQCLVRYTPPNDLAVYHRLFSLFPAPELPQEVLAKLVETIWFLDGRFRLNIEDSRRLLTFLPRAREQLDTERFLRITHFALRNSARLPPDDFRRVHSDVRGALDVVVEYFSSSGVEEVARMDSWWDFGNLLIACVELARVDTARPTTDGTLFTRDVINALERCTLRCPEDEFGRNDIREQMGKIRSTFGYSDGSIPNEPIAVKFVSLAPAMQDADEAPRGHLQVVEGTPMQ